MSGASLEEYDRQQLLAEIDELKRKLGKKKAELIKTKSRMANYRNKVLKMKATIAYQRARILQLYNGEPVSEIN
jgi:hypothetical protein